MSSEKNPTVTVSVSVTAWHIQVRPPATLARVILLVFLAQLLAIAARPPSLFCMRMEHLEPGNFFWLSSALHEVAALAQLRVLVRQAIGLTMQYLTLGEGQMRTLNAIRVTLGHPAIHVAVLSQLTRRAVVERHAQELKEQRRLKKEAQDLKQAVADFNVPLD